MDFKYVFKEVNTSTLLVMPHPWKGQTDLPVLSLCAKRSFARYQGRIPPLFTDIANMASAIHIADRFSHASDKDAVRYIDITVPVYEFERFQNPESCPPNEWNSCLVNK